MKKLLLIPLLFCSVVFGQVVMDYSVGDTMLSAQGQVIRIISGGNYLRSNAQTICVGDTVYLTGSGSADLLIWEMFLPNGDLAGGTFSDKYNDTTYYYPSAEDYGNRYLTAKLIGYNYSSLNSETETLVTRFETTQNTNQVLAIDSMITFYKDSALWDSLDVIYAMDLSDSVGALQNWKSNNYNMTAVSGIEHTARLGYLNTDNTGHINTNWAPSNGVNYSLLNAATVMKSRTQLIENKYDFGVIDGDGRVWDAFTYASRWFCYMNAITVANPGNTISTGVFVSNRFGDTVSMYRDDTEVFYGEIAYSQLATLPVWIGDVNNGGSSLGNTRKRYSYFAAGSALDEEERRKLNNILLWWEGRLSLYF